MVTALQEEQIRQLRKQGSGYRQIGRKLNLSRDTVRNTCRKYEIDSGQTVLRDKCQLLGNDNKCRYCGASIEQAKTGRKRHFCSSVCRDTWWKENRDKIHQSPEAIYGFVCKTCGKEFTAYGNQNRKYCSRECFAIDRFWGGQKPAQPKEIDLNTMKPVVQMIS